MGQGGLSEAGRTVEKQVVHWLSPLAGGLDEDFEIFLELLLANEFAQELRTNGKFVCFSWELVRIKRVVSHALVDFSLLGEGEG